MGFKYDVLRRLVKIQDSLDRLLKRGCPVSGVVLLMDCPTTWSFFMAVKKMVAIPTFDMDDLVTKGALLQLFTASDDPCPLPPAGTYTVAWTSADPATITIAQDPANPAGAVVNSLKPGQKIKLDGILTDSTVPPGYAPVDCSCFVNVKSPVPAQGVIAIAP